MTQDSRDFFEAKYDRERSRAARELEQLALGQAAGLNGYTTVAQAQALCEHLELSSEGCLLDVGAGRGWPGSHIARAGGARLISTDLPWDALLEAKANAVCSPFGPSEVVVAADGCALPLRDHSVTAAVHADVLC